MFYNYQALDMIKTIKLRLPLSIKKVVLLSCAIAIGFLSIFSEGVWARRNVKSFVETGLQDTLTGFSGKIVDSITNVPIPFAAITFYKKDAGSMTIVSDGKGDFSTDLKQLESRVQLSAIGYQEHTCYLNSAHANLVRLVPVNNPLPDVIVSSKFKRKPRANWIIKKVNQHIDQNYGDLFFDQTFRVYLSTRNYDTIKGERTDLIGLRFDKDLLKMHIKDWHKETMNEDPVFFNFIGVPRLSSGYIEIIGDIIRRGLVTGEKRLNNFDFRLLAHYQDKNYGSVYHVSFKPHSIYNDFFLTGHTAAELPLGYLKGEMLIREDDYAVVSLKYIWELDVKPSNRGTENAYHSPDWKADRLPKIITIVRLKL